jgi:hypothetical protein
MALNRYIFLHAHWMDAIEWLIYYPSGSGGSRKSFKGWRFVGGGGAITVKNRFLKSIQGSKL